MVKSESIVAKKAYSFALEIIRIYKVLMIEKKEFILARQLLRAGTSIGANINEALSAQSKKDFIHKMNIALKEGRESLYWISLLKDSDYIDQEQFDRLYPACKEIIKMLNSIIITTKDKYLSNTGNSKL